MSILFAGLPFRQTSSLIRPKTNNKSCARRQICRALIGQTGKTYLHLNAHRQKGQICRLATFRSSNLRALCTIIIEKCICKKIKYRGKKKINKL